MAMVELFNEHIVYRLTSGPLYVKPFLGKGVSGNTLLRQRFTLERVRV